MVNFEFDTKLKLIIILIITNLISLGFIGYYHLLNEPETIIQHDYIDVQIAGEINNPGVYKLESGTMLYELIEIAGGLTEEAKIDNLNLVQELKHGTKITIFSINYIPNENSQSGLININLATKSELMKLNGIGEVKAQRIIDYRNQYGPFSSIEELKNVSGIGEKTFDAIKDYICI